MGMNIILIDKNDKGEEYSVLDMTLFLEHREACDEFLDESLTTALDGKKAKDTIDMLSKLNKEFGGKQESKDNDREPLGVEDMAARLYNAAKKHPNAEWLLC